MNHQAFNNSFSVLASGQAKPSHVVLVNGKRHRGATRSLFHRYHSRIDFNANSPQRVGPKRAGHVGLRASVEPTPTSPTRARHPGVGTRPASPSRSGGLPATYANLDRGNDNARPRCPTPPPGISTEQGLFS